MFGINFLTGISFTIAVDCSRMNDLRNKGNMEWTHFLINDKSKNQQIDQSCRCFNC